MGVGEWTKIEVLVLDVEAFTMSCTFGANVPVSVVYLQERGGPLILGKIDVC